MAAQSPLTSHTQTITTKILSGSTFATDLFSTSPAKATGWSSPDSLLTSLFAGKPSTILLAFVVTLTFPVLLHLYYYTQSARNKSSGTGGDGVPVFLLVGPSGSGKTSLVTLLQRQMVALDPTQGGSEAENSDEDDGTQNEKSPRITVNGDGTRPLSPTQTRLSQTSTTHHLRLPPGTPLGSNKYRSENDYEVAASRTTMIPYTLIDTPGHGKLRASHALSIISKANTDLKGVLFLLDSSAMDASVESVDGGESAKDAVQYLHDVLLALQRRPKVVKKCKAEDVRVLVACNKQDLFTSLPAGAVRERLQVELERVRLSKRRGISAVDAKADRDEDEDETVLGGGGEDRFSFKLLEEEFGVGVDVVGGAVKEDEDGKGVRKWEQWIGGCL